MDEGQQWAITIAAEALADYGYPDRPLDTERTGVILGTAMGGEMHYITAQRIAFPEYANWLRAAPEFQRLPANTQMALMEQFHAVMDLSLIHIYIASCLLTPFSITFVTNSHTFSPLEYNPGT